MTVAIPDQMGRSEINEGLGLLLFWRAKCMEIFLWVCRRDYFVDILGHLEMVVARPAINNSHNS